MKKTQLFNGLGFLALITFFLFSRIENTLSKGPPPAHSSQDGATKTIETANLKIVDENGLTRLELTKNGISIFDKSARPRIVISLSQDAQSRGSSGLTFFSQKGDLQLMISAADDGESSIRLCEKGWKPIHGLGPPAGVELRVSADAESSMSLRGNNGQEVASISTSLTNGASFDLYGKQGNNIQNAPGLISLRAEPDKNPTIEMRDTENKQFWIQSKK